MKTTVEKTEAFKCPLSFDVFDTKEKAEKCFLGCKRAQNKADREKKLRAKLRERRERLRLEADSIEAIKEIFIRDAKEIWGMTIKFKEFRVNFGDIHISRNAPIGKKVDWNDKTTTFPGWCGHIEGTYSAKKGRNDRGPTYPGDLIGDEYKEGFVGLHSGCFSGGSNTFGGEIYFFLDDFPKLKASYEVYQELLKAEKIYQSKVLEQGQKVYGLADKWIAEDLEISNLYDAAIGINTQIEELKKQLDAVNSKISEMRKVHVDNAEKQREVKFSIPKKYEYDTGVLSKLKKRFNRNYY